MYLLLYWVTYDKIAGDATKFEVIKCQLGYPQIGLQCGNEANKAAIIITVVLAC